MLSRFVRSTPARQLARNGYRSMSSVLSAEGKTEAELLGMIDAVPNLEAEETVVLKPAGEDAFTIEPVTDSELLDALAQQSVAGDTTGTAEESEEGFLDAIGLGPFHRRASLIATGAVTAISNEFYVINEETMVAVCLAIGFSSMYVALREGGLEAYHDWQKETLDAQQEAEDKHIAACQTLISAQSGSENIVEAVRNAFEEKEALVHAEAAAKAIAERNKVAKDFETKLQGLVNRKADEENKAYKVLIDSVHEEVLKAATTDSKFKKAALKYALTAISTPEKAGANPTVTLYEQKLKQ